jgi:hypothetical protein
MKAHLRLRGGKLVVEVESSTSKDLFRAVAELTAVFEAERECGCCHSQDLQFRVRTIDGNDYYELFCEDCSAAFNFGQTRNGNSLFPKRKDAGGILLPDRGWKVWRALPPGEAPVNPRRTHSAKIQSRISVCAAGLPMASHA